MRSTSCQLVIALVSCLFSLVLLGLSLEAVTSISHTSVWIPVDYWLAWFSAVSFVGGIVCAICTYAFFANLCFAGP
jgi:hypothetical protein